MAKAIVLKRETARKLLEKLREVDAVNVARPGFTPRDQGSSIDMLSLDRNAVGRRQAFGWETATSAGGVAADDLFSFQDTSNSRAREYITFLDLIGDIEVSIVIDADQITDPENLFLNDNLTYRHDNLLWDPSDPAKVDTEAKAAKNNANHSYRHSLLGGTATGTQGAWFQSIGRGSGLGPGGAGNTIAIDLINDILYSRNGVPANVEMLKWDWNTDGVQFMQGLKINADTIKSAGLAIVPVQTDVGDLKIGIDSLLWATIDMISKGKVDIEANAASLWQVDGTLSLWPGSDQTRDLNIGEENAFEWQNIRAVVSNEFNIVRTGGGSEVRVYEDGFDVVTGNYAHEGIEGGSTAEVSLSLTGGGTVKGHYSGGLWIPS